MKDSSWSEGLPLACVSVGAAREAGCGQAALQPLRPTGNGVFTVGIHILKQ